MSLLLATSGDIASGVVEPEGVDFDGVSDYLSRSTDLTGNVDSKTFTFSCWVYNGNVSSVSSIYSVGTATAADIYIRSNLGYLELVLGYGEFGSTGVQLRTPDYSIPKDTWSHILISCDTSNTTKRHVIINDIAVSTTWTTYNNQAIKLTSIYNSKYIGIGISSFDNSSKIKGRTSHLFIDYTYRDLSIEANRRLFITAAGKPTPTATLKALNPILYLPMKDAATAHINEGTGGNFTLNGTIATSNRGANQDNCVASYLNGTSQYLSRTSLTGVADGKQFTLSFNYYIRVDTTMDIFSTSTGKVTSRYGFADKRLSFWFKNSSNTTILSYYVPLVYSTLKTNHTISTSCDTLNGTIKVSIDGVVVAPTIVTNTNDTIDFSSADQYYIGNGANGFNAGNIGELYFDTKYIDLATLNPFWGSVENKPISVRKVIANTGVTPLIAMPLDASNAGKNYGTGGDFTANSGPYVGARGGSEVWARSVLVDNSNYLTYTGGLLCASLVKWVSTDSGVTWNVSYLNNVTVTNIGAGTDNGRVAYYFGTSELINWALEVNKLRFTDGLGYPIQPTIDNNTLLYLAFNNPTNFGKNDGSGNDLIITGTVTQSSDVKA